MRATLAAVVFLSAPMPLIRAQEVWGIVTDDATGTPVPRVEVTLVTAGADPLEALTYTDSRGAFGFTALPAGKYLLRARHHRYLPVTYGASTPDAAPEILVIKAGEARRRLDIRLRPVASITGVVLDPDGDPIPQAQVSVLVAGFARRKPIYFPIRSAQADSRGAYRIPDLPPGQYLVRATASYQLARPIHPEGVPEQPQDQPKYGAQFYSNADRLSAASLISVSQGKELKGIDFQLPLRHMVRLKGNVVLPADLGEATVQIQASLQDLPEHQTIGTAARPPDYKFELPDLVPGAYLVVAQAQAQGRWYSGSAHADAGETADQQLSITLQPGIELAGRVVVEGDGPGPEPAQVRLVPGDRVTHIAPEPHARLKPDGTFRLANVLPGVWDIGVEPLPPGAFIKSMRLGEQDVLTEDMVIDAGTNAPLNIVVSKRGGIVEGTVVLDDPAQPVRAVVMLAPQGRFEHVLSFYATKLADETGHFEFKGVTPGPYKLYAFDRMRQFGPQDPDFLKPYRETGEPLEVVEGGRITKKVHLIGVPK